MKYENQFKIKLKQKNLGKCKQTNTSIQGLIKRKMNYCLDNHLAFIHEIEITIKKNMTNSRIYYD